MWKNIYINSNLIQRDTGRAVLFAMPKNGRYAGWTFWHPEKCVHGVHGRTDCVCIGYTDEWDFRLIKKDNTMNITVKEFEEAFEKMDSNIRPWIGKKNTFKDLDVDIVHTPEEIMPILNPEADKELVDD